MYVQYVKLHYTLCYTTMKQHTSYTCQTHLNCADCNLLHKAHSCKEKHNLGHFYKHNLGHFYKQKWSKITHTHVPRHKIVLPKQSHPNQACITNHRTNQSSVGTEWKLNRPDNNNNNNKKIASSDDVSQHNVKKEKENKNMAPEPLFM